MRKTTDGQMKYLKWTCTRERTKKKMENCKTKWYIHYKYEGSENTTDKVLADRCWSSSTSTLYNVHCTRFSQGFPFILYAQAERKITRHSGMSRLSSSSSVFLCFFFSSFRRNRFVTKECFQCLKRRWSQLCQFSERRNDVLHAHVAHSVIFIYR